jgi:sulfur carrier protein
MPSLTVNGEPADHDADTVQQLLQRLDLHRQVVAVEVNGELVPRKQHAQQQLADGDTVELVTLVGGG